MFRSVCMCRLCICLTDFKSHDKKIEHETMITKRQICVCQNIFTNTVVITNNTVEGYS